MSGELRKEPTNTTCMTQFCEPWVARVPKNCEHAGPEEFLAISRTFSDNSLDRDVPIQASAIRPPNPP